jgi:uncharacterized membrane-anchored protein YitT (DUF2179 family)/predicted metal-dependent HD superfamily phosphohydrolase
MQFEEAYTFLIKKLENELPPYLTYHCVAHTKEVIDAVKYLSAREDLSEEERQLLCTAALFHDSGFLHTYDNHEKASCDVAKSILPRYGYSSKQIEIICELIMATKLPQRPKNNLANIICDADLLYLGTDTYFEKAENLYAEFKHQKKVKNRRGWYHQQVNFLGSHQYFTPAAKQEGNMKKAENLQKIRADYKKQNVTKGVRSFVQDFIYIIAGVIIAGFALKGFLVPNNFFDGGVTGMSLLIHELYHFNLAYAIVLCNLPLLIISYFIVNKSFAFKTFTTVVLLGICLLFFPYPIITSDKLLISIFGGFFLGVGTGLTMRAGCALDGIEVLALYTLKRSSFTITEIILGINVIIFVIAAFKFGLETSLYSILTYFTASRTIDYVIEGIEAYTGVTIISSESEMIKEHLVKDMGRGITVYKGERGFLPGSFEVSNDVDIIFTVITRLELRKLKNLVYETDAKAFIFASTIKEASGGIVKRRRRGHG